MSLGIQEIIVDEVLYILQRWVRQLQKIFIHGKIKRSSLHTF